MKGECMVILRDVMTRHFEMIHPEVSLKDAAAKMSTMNLSMLPVCEEKRVVGVLKGPAVNRRMQADERDPRTVKVRDVMEAVTLTGRADQELKAIVLQMREKKVAVLPVLDLDESLIGVFSLGGPWKHLRRSPSRS
jgi:predicted transcriptional regulator